MTTPAQPTTRPTGDIFEIAINHLADTHARERRLLLARAVEFARAERTLAALRANGVEVSAHSVQFARSGAPGVTGELIVMADIPAHCRPRLQQLLDVEALALAMVAGHSRDNSVIKHASGWHLFVQWVETAPEAMQVAA